jgi:hypothetical protein
MRIIATSMGDGRSARRRFSPAISNIAVIAGAIIIEAVRWAKE